MNMIIEIQRYYMYCTPTSIQFQMQGFTSITSTKVAGTQYLNHSNLVLPIPPLHFTPIYATEPMQPLCFYLYHLETSHLSGL